MTTSAFGVELGEISKAAHRRDESNVTATYGHRAEINQHARSGGVREAGSSTNVSIGNQRTLSGNGPGARASQRALVRSVKVRRVSPKAAGVALVGAGAAGAAAHHHSIKKSAFDVNLTAADVVEKALTDPNGNMFQRPSRKNTRGQNAQAGATVGGAEYGAVGVAAGAAGARHHAAGNSHALGRAAEGIFHSGKQPTASSLKRSASVGRTLSRVKGGSKGAAVGAALGVGFGAGIGAIQPARKDGKKLPRGRVS